MSGFNLQDYVTVPERIALFFAKYPEGSFQVVNIEPLSIGGQDYLLYVAAAYRSPDDQRPSHGTAWELVPGPTQFTRGSEAQNAETAAIGRAIAALGIGAKRSVSSAEDILKSTAEAEAREQLTKNKKEVLTLAKQWAKDNDGEYETKQEVVEAFLDARGLELPAKDASADEWLQLLGAIKDGDAA